MKQFQLPTKDEQNEVLTPKPNQFMKNNPKPEVVNIHSWGPISYTYLVVELVTKWPVWKFDFRENPVVQIGVGL